jgi:hypothetical protein
MNKYYCIVLLFMFIFNNIYSYEVQYSPTFTNIIFQLHDIKYRINNNYISLNNKNKSNTSNHIDYKTIKTYISNHSNISHNQKLLFDDTNGKITFISNSDKEGIPRITNRDKYKKIALEFLKNNIPNVLNNGEELNVLYMGEDYSSEQTTDENGKLLPYLIEKTNSIIVSVGRNIMDMPIFNCLAIIEISAKTEKVIFYNLDNWVSVNYLKIENLSILSKDSIEEKIAEKYKSVYNTSFIENLQSHSLNIDKIELDHIMIGWIFNSNMELIPAFVHHGNYILRNIKTGELTTDECSFMEKVE